METLTLRHKSLLDDDEFYRFCRENEDLRIERDPNGFIQIMANTGGKTGDRNAELTTQLRIWNKKARLGVSFDSSTAFRLPSSAVRSPDAAWVKKSRWEALSEREQEQFPPLCPDFVVELLSATDQLADARRKMLDDWIASGCRLAWLIDPQAQTTHVFRANGEIQIIPGFDRVLSGEDVLVGFALELGELR